MLLIKNKKQINAGSKWPFSVGSLKKKVEKK